MPDSVEAESHLDTLEDFKLREPVISQSTQKQSTKVIARPFFVAFLTIFLAELGDKTQLATLLMSAESQSPWVVFIGAASALVITSLLGVLLGQWLASRLAPGILRTATGASLLFISVLLLWDVAHLL
jgi:putative Ca2+/H+ antiporter (TMEM165/GDT1 family)